VYCVDFGLSKRYRHPKNLQHIPHRDGRSLTGTPRYASINNHLGIEQSRRDDLESIGYVLIYFLKGTLPWQGLKAKNAQKKYRMILEKKQQVSIAQLCQGCPSQFAEFLAYTRSLKFDAKPDIPYLRKLFRDMYHAQGCANVGKLWDWDNLDADYSTGADAGGGGGGAPLMGANPPRPSTAAAVAPSGGAAIDDQMILGDDYPSSHGNNNAAANTSGRPSTAGAAGARPQAAGTQKQTWAPTGGDGASGQGGSQSAADQSRRPHTANAASFRQIQHDPRSGGGGGEEDDGDDAHVVAGARAMMRYRRTRATSQEPAGAPAQTGNVSATGPGSQQLWAGSQDPGGYSAPQRQQQLLQQQQMMQQQQQQQQQVRAKSAGTSGRSAQPVQGGGATQGQGGAAPVASGTGWMNGSAQQMQADGRPKSAGMCCAVCVCMCCVCVCICMCVCVCVYMSYVLTSPPCPCRHHEFLSGRAAGPAAAAAASSLPLLRLPAVTVSVRWGTAAACRPTGSHWSSWWHSSPEHAGEK